MTDQPHTKPTHKVLCVVKLPLAATRAYGYKGLFRAMRNGQRGRANDPADLTPDK